MLGQESNQGTWVKGKCTNELAKSRLSHQVFFTNNAHLVIQLQLPQENRLLICSKLVIFTANSNLSLGVIFQIKTVSNPALTKIRLMLKVCQGKNATPFKCMEVVQHVHTYNSLS